MHRAFLTVNLTMTLKSGVALRAAPLVYPMLNRQSKTPYAENGRLGHTAFLTVNLALTLTSGAALIQAALHLPAFKVIVQR